VYVLRRYIFMSSVLVSLVGLAYGGELAHCLSDSWISRFGPLRQVGLQEELEEDDDQKNAAGAAAGAGADSVAGDRFDVSRGGLGSAMMGRRKLSSSNSSVQGIAMDKSDSFESHDGLGLYGPSAPSPGSYQQRARRPLRSRPRPRAHHYSYSYGYRNASAPIHSAELPSKKKQ
jgi:hypothetical protein